uniref:Leucine rich repeats and calponin homology domain containing 2 n=1 Tax=Varanus komodoensis TaxID=61221 RepID=A0A8D2L1Q5_VARKO
MRISWPSFISSQVTNASFPAKVAEYLHNARSYVHSVFSESSPGFIICHESLPPTVPGAGKSGIQVAEGGRNSRKGTAKKAGGLNLGFPPTEPRKHVFFFLFSILDLSKNRFAEIPPDVWQFAPLETLNLYHNCIKSIPEAIRNLQMLTYLNISRNLLSTLPKYLFDLPLKVLVVSNNKLVSIPEEIGKLRDLMELDVSCNEIQVLPQQIGKLQSLKELNLRRNNLHMLPDELGDLPLVKLDFSCNKVTEIPICYRKLRQLQVIILDNNPMQMPPAQICLKGKVHIFKFLSIQACLRMDKKPDSLDLPSLGKRIPSHLLTLLRSRTSPSKPFFPSAAFGRSRQDYSTMDPGFTMRRKMEHLREEREQIKQLRCNLESRLKVSLPDDIGAALMDGVVLCHLANHIRPRSVASIHVPSPAVPKLSMAKCRRNVENFLDACKKLGVPQERLCLPHHILEERGLVKVGLTVQALLEIPSSKVLFTCEVPV